MTARIPETIRMMAIAAVVATLMSVSVCGWFIRFNQIPRYAQMTTRLKARSFRRASIRYVKSVPTAIMRIVQVN